VVGIDLIQAVSFKDVTETGVINGLDEGHHSRAKDLSIGAECFVLLHTKPPMALTTFRVSGNFKHRRGTPKGLQINMALMMVPFHRNTMLK
jgi:hypothetical protein